MTLDKGPPESRCFLRTERIKITLCGDDTAHELWQRIGNSEWHDLVQILRAVINRCLRGIRNFGVVPSLRALRESPNENAEAILRRWGAEVEANGEWQKLLPEIELFALGAFLTSSPTVHGELQVVRWSLIEEAIQDDLEPPPELEFTTNAVEHLRLDNQRFSLLEAIIGLEIVLTRWLTVYLTTEKGLSKTRIRQFLSPDLGLSSRLAAVLDLTMDRRTLKTIDLTKVLSAVKWRNHVMHRTGKLPADLSEELIRDRIAEVLSLISILARNTERLEQKPAMDALPDQIKATPGDLPRPVVAYWGHHRVSVQFMGYGTDDGWIPPESDVAALAKKIEDIRVATDRRFRSELHLRIVFRRFPNEIRASWDRGIFEKVK